MSLARIALRSVSRRKLRNSLTVLAVVIGVALLTGVNIAFDSAYIHFVNTINRSSGSIDISIRSATGASLNDSLLPEIRQVEGVAEASGRVSGSGYAVFWNVTEESSAPLSVYGVDPNGDFDYLNPDYTNITGVRSLSPGQIVVDSRLNYTIGQRIKIRVKSDYYWLEVVGLYHLPAEIQGLHFAGSYTAYVDLPAAQKLFKTWGRFNRIIARVDDVSNTRKVVERLESRLGGEYEVTAEKERILDRMRSSLEGFRSGLFVMSALTSAVALVIVFNTVYMNVKERMYEIGVIRSIGASKTQVFWMFILEGMLLGVIGTTVGLAGGFLLANILGGTLLPAPPSSSPQEILLIYKPGTIALGIVTGILTTLIGGLIPSILAGRTEILKALRPSMRMTIHRRLHWILLLVGAVLFLTGVFMWSSANPRSVTTIPQTGVASIPLLIIGLVLTTAGLIRGTEKIFEYLLYPAFGKTSRLASRNFSRNLVRTTICFMLIAMSLSFIVALGGIQFSVNAGIEETVTSFFQSDIIVFSGTTPIERGFWKELVNLEHGTLIEKASPVRVIGTNLRALTQNENVSVSVTAIHTPNGAYSDKYCSYPDVMDMTFTPETPPDVYQRLHDVNTIILSSGIARTLGARVGSKVNVLSLLEIQVAPGVLIHTPTWRIFDVIGIVEIGMEQSPMMAQMAKMCYISYHTLNEQWGEYKDEANMFYVRVKPEYSENIGYVRDRILGKFGRSRGIGVITRIDILDAIRENMNEMWGLFNNLILFSVVVTAIGMTSIMIMNISERRREIGIIRSQGMSRIQVAKIIIGEAIILGGIGLLLGTIAGLVYYRGVVYVMAETGFSTGFRIPLEAIRTATLLSFGISVASVLYPLHKANSLDIVEAVRRNE